VFNLRSQQSSHRTEPHGVQGGGWRADVLCGDSGRAGRHTGRQARTRVGLQHARQAGRQAGTQADRQVCLGVFPCERTGSKDGHTPSIRHPSSVHPGDILFIFGPSYPKRATKIVGLEGHPLHANTPIIILRRKESTMYKIYGIRHRRLLILDFYQGGVQT